jgi:AcrR family transcriptional regulator
MEIKTTAVSPATRDLILDQAERLIATKGLHGFTLKDIAEPLGVVVPALYKHYKNRDDILVALSRRLIALLSDQFRYAREDLKNPAKTLMVVIGEFVRFHISHPAYVRLSLIDFATPEGGMEYIRLAAGGEFRSNLVAGPLAPMHRRLRDLLKAGESAGVFRATPEVDFYRFIKSVLLIRLVFPDDLLVDPRPGRATIRLIEESLFAMALRQLSPSRPKV